MVKQPNKTTDSVIELSQELKVKIQWLIMRMLQSFTKDVGEKVRFVCGHSITEEAKREVPGINLTWTMNQHPLIMNPSRILFYKDNVDLTDLTPADSGVYTCGLSWATGLKNTTLGVYSLQVTSESPTTYVFEGERLQLSCHSCALGALFPEAMRHWVWNGTYVSSPAPTKADIQTDDAISHVSKKQEGVWECHVIHRATQRMWKTAWYKIVVEDPPSVAARWYRFALDNPIPVVAVLGLVIFLLIVLFVISCLWERDKEEAASMEFRQERNGWESVLAKHKNKEKIRPEDISSTNEETRTLLSSAYASESKAGSKAKSITIGSASSRGSDRTAGTASVFNEEEFENGENDKWRDGEVYTEADESFGSDSNVNFSEDGHTFYHRKMDDLVKSRKTYDNDSFASESDSARIDRRSLKRVRRKLTFDEEWDNMMQADQNMNASSGNFGVLEKYFESISLTRQPQEEKQLKANCSSPLVVTEAAKQWLEKNRLSIKTIAKSSQKETAVTSVFQAPSTSNQTLNVITPPAMTKLIPKVFTFENRPDHKEDSIRLREKPVPNRSSSNVCALPDIDEVDFEKCGPKESLISSMKKRLQRLRQSKADEALSPFSTIKYHALPQNEEQFELQEL